MSKKRNGQQRLAPAVVITPDGPVSIPRPPDDCPRILDTPVGQVIAYRSAHGKVGIRRPREVLLLSDEESRRFRLTGTYQK